MINFSFMKPIFKPDHMIVFKRLFFKFCGGFVVFYESGVSSFSVMVSRGDVVLGSRWCGIHCCCNSLNLFSLILCLISSMRRLKKDKL